MKFTFIADVKEPVKCYTGELVSTGDVIELSDYLSQKALKNPNYEVYKEVGKCMGFTAKGEQCTRPQTHGSYCFQHVKESHGDQSDVKE